MTISMAWKKGRKQWLVCDKDQCVIIKLNQINIIKLNQINQWIMLIHDNIVQSAKFILYKFLVVIPLLSCVLRKNNEKLFPQRAPYVNFHQLIFID